MYQVSHTGIRATVLLLIFCSVSLSIFGRGPGKGYSSGIGSSIGVRAGWSGGPTGISFRRAFAPGQAFELNAGYNPKEGRHSGLTFPRVGNTMVDFRYQPYTYACDGNVGFLIYGSVGGRARIHNYRLINESNTRGMVVTPDFLGGAGCQFEFNDTVEIFADLSAKYHNKKSGEWVWGLESGFGLRVKLN